MYSDRTMISAEALERAAAARPPAVAPTPDTSAMAPVRGNGRRRATTVLLGLGAIAATVLLPAGTANADPSASTWQRLRQCESSNRYDINTGNGYYGAYQFNLATWRPGAAWAVPVTRTRPPRPSRTRAP